jgi:hypothetical protein
LHMCTFSTHFVIVASISHNKSGAIESYCMGWQIALRIQ